MGLLCSYLTITGRLKEIINRGGEKISPAEVDDVLMDHPAIQQAVTFAMISLARRWRRRSYCTRVLPSPNVRSGTSSPRGLPISRRLEK